MPEGGSIGTPDRAVLFCSRSTMVEMADAGSAPAVTFSVTTDHTRPGNPTFVAASVIAPMTSSE